MVGNGNGTAPSVFGESFFETNGKTEKLSSGAYWSVGAAFALAIALALAFILVPARSRAFWPFTRADAQSAPTPYIHDDTADIALKAAVNSNPAGAVGGADIAMVNGSALLPYMGPDGSLADLGGATPSDRISLYVVRSGDSLSDIAGMFGVSINTIIWANNLSGAGDIHPGDTLVILPVSGIRHTVKTGDTFASLAKKYGADGSEIAQFNGLDSSQALTVGTEIIIPGGELAAPPAHSRHYGSLANPYRGGGGPALGGYFRNPLPGAILTQGLHGWNGVDLGAPRGTSILAAASGDVIIAKVGGWNGGYGNYVVLTHGNGTQTLYAHLSRIIVSPGSPVAEGQVIGYVGATGEATGPHLHFEVRGARNPFAALCTVGASCYAQD